MSLAAGPNIPRVAGVLAAGDPPRPALVAGATLPADSTLEQLLDDSGIPGGVIVHAGCAGGQHTASLVRRGNDLVQGLGCDATLMEHARQHALTLEHGGRLTFRHWPGGGLPYADDLVNVIVWDRPAGAADRAEILRVLAPGGAAYIRNEHGWAKVTKPWPDDIREW